MLRSLNRDQLVEVLQSGFTDVAYFLGFPEDALYKLAEQRNLPKYPFDPDGAQRQFAEIGWTKGTDGLLHNAAGETIHFYCCRYPSADSNDIRESLAWGNDFRTAGFEVEHPLPDAPAGASSSEQRRVRITGQWGGQIGNFRTSSDQYFATLLGANIPKQETQWVGINNPGWTNPAYEDLFTKSVRTLDAAPRLELQFQMFQIMAQELPILPAYYNPLGVAVRKGVTGIGKGAVLNRGVTWNINTWDIQ
jgi:peptide/nickel transport system substrate-binding protein